MVNYQDWTFAENEALLDILGGVEVARNLINGNKKAVITTVKVTIDCSVVPFTPEGWTVRTHRDCGKKIELDLENIKFYLSEGQKLPGKYIDGEELDKELANQPVLNANVLDYLLAHQECIPQAWRNTTLFFWGTTYITSSKHVCVRGLSFKDDCWSNCHTVFKHGFSLNSPAAILG